MWAVVKVNKKKISFFKNELKKKFGSEVIIYSPKILIKKIKKKKTLQIEHEILGDYLFCYYKNFNNLNFLYQFNFIKGVKTILNGYQFSQKEIKEFIKKCKSLEDSMGYISQSFYEKKIENYYRFISGPFTNLIFKIVQLQKNKFDILIGNLKTSINNKEFLFSPV